MPFCMHFSENRLFNWRSFLPYVRGMVGAEQVVPSMLLGWMGRSGMQLAWSRQWQPFWHPLQADKLYDNFYTSVVWMFSRGMKAPTAMAPRLPGCFITCLIGLPSCSLYSGSVVSPWLPSGLVHSGQKSTCEIASVCWLWLELSPCGDVCVAWCIEYETCIISSKVFSPKFRVPNMHYRLKFADVSVAPNFKCLICMHYQWPEIWVMPLCI